MITHLYVIANIFWISLFDKNPFHGKIVLLIFLVFSSERSIVSVSQVKSIIINSVTFNNNTKSN